LAWRIIPKKIASSRHLGRAPKRYGSNTMMTKDVFDGCAHRPNHPPACGALSVRGFARQYNDLRKSVFCLPQSGHFAARQFL